MLSQRLLVVLIWLSFWRNSDFGSSAWIPRLQSFGRPIRCGLSRQARVFEITRPPYVLSLARKDSESDSPSTSRKRPNNKKRPGKKRKASSPTSKSKEEKKQAVVKAAAELRKGKADETKTNIDKKGSLLDALNPYEAGRKVRQTIDTALTTFGAGAKLSADRRSIYYADDRFLEPGGALFSERNPLFDRMQSDGYVPEVLVVGATGAVGRLVVRRLLLDGRFRVRVLVRDLYSKTLNLLGTGVTYCQGDLSNIESLEYALTDVDKIVFCAGAPRADEADFSNKFEAFVKENLKTDEPLEKQEQSQSDLEWEELESVVELRARLAEQCDLTGMKNLVRAYQNVRFADYGTSQAAKRSLFKFQDRPEDFGLFAIDEEGDDDGGTVGGGTIDSAGRNTTMADSGLYGADEYGNDDDYDDDYFGMSEDDMYAAINDEYADDYASDDEMYEQESYTATATRKGAAVKTQVQWIKNKFEHGVFVGKVPKQIGGGLGGEAAVVSSRLRAREDPDSGIDLSNGFAGFVCRVCADGSNYEAFIRSENYETDGIEYVCEFGTTTKPLQKGQSKNRFMTVRLPFQNFRPVQRKGALPDAPKSVPCFKGQDVRQIGFRYRSESNKEKSKLEKGEMSSFYLALCYIKVYRSQPEPEFVYLSDARIPPVVHDNMVRHDARQLVLATSSDGGGGTPVSLLDEATLKSVTDRKGRSAEETYFKFRGEEILKNSGLSYAIVRVCGYNESPSGEASTIDLLPSNDEELEAVSRDEVAQVCVNALMDPEALNKSFYMTKTRRKKGKASDLSDDSMSKKFAELPADKIL